MLPLHYTDPGLGYKHQESHFDPSTKDYKNYMFKFKQKRLTLFDAVVLDSHKKL